MQNRFPRAALLAGALFWMALAGGRLAAAPTARVTVDADKPGAAVSPLLYGIFFEEINRAGDGGIYAEMIQNRSFEDADTPLGWRLMQDAGARASMALDRGRPLNAKNPTSLRLEIAGTGGGRVGVASHGFRGVPQRPRERPELWLPRFEQASGGIHVQRGRRYDLSFYARAAAGFAGPLAVTLEGKNNAVIARQNVGGIGPGWKKFTAALTAGATDTDARLVLAASQPGTVWLDMISLFPRDTWKGRKNGLRPDLMGMIERMRPAFVRFPGGCFVEGERMADAFRWKETIGDISVRPGHWNLWGYRSTDGLGYHEYLQMCEDLGAEPLFVVNCGMAHRDHVPMERMGEYVQDALDAIEYANGPVTSRWGALRARNGHPRPFHLKLIQIGNENGGPLYDERYALFHDAIKKRYPEMRLIACEWQGLPRSRPLDIIDPHLYANPRTFLRQAARYDTYDRRGPKIYFGEYAVTQEAGTGNLQAALGEAAFMTGLERNGDVVVMSSYAPLLSDPSWKTWNPNAIVFDQARLYGTPSYWVQTLFAAHRGDVVLPVQIEQPALPVEVPHGQIGVGTWGTQAEFKDIKVTRGDQTLFAADLSRGMEGWRRIGGRWEVADGALRQTGNEDGARIMAGDPGWTDYTLSLKARKLGGREGFLILFHTPEGSATSWWNLGGWNNTQHGVELPGAPTAQVPGSIETGRWYDIRVELQGPTIRCYLDNALVQEVTRSTTPPPALFAVAGRDNETGETVLKVVNASDHPLETTVEMRGAGRVAPRGRALVLTGNAEDENSFAAPLRVAPREEAVRVSGPSFRRTFPARSVTVLRLKVTAARTARS